MEEENLSKKPPSPLAMRALGQAFLSAGEHFAQESFVKAGENLFNAADDIDPPPTQNVEKSSSWVAVSFALSAIGVGLGQLLGWLADDYWSALWGMAPIVVLLAWLPWGMESKRRDADARKAFEKLQEWRKKRLLREL
jgi:hypothetical protein